MPLTQIEVSSALAVAVDKAREDGLSISIAIVDESGFLQGLARMDAAAPLTSRVAEAKAVGAALFRRDGDALAEMMNARPAFFSQVERLSPLPLVAAPGSLLIRREDAVVGAIGVSGAAPQQDTACAQAGLESIGR
jgi:glc operon protein GlcG